MLTTPGPLVRGSEAGTGTAWGSGELHGHVMPSSNTQAAAEEGYGPPPALPLPINSVFVAVTSIPGSNTPALPGKEFLQLLLPSLLPCMRSACFCMPALVGHGVTPLLVLQKQERRCFPPSLLACSPPCQHILTLLLPSARKEETVTVYPADVVLFEGILAFYSQEVRDLFRMKLFVDTDADTRLSRRGEARMCVVQQGEKCGLKLAPRNVREMRVCV